MGARLRWASATMFTICPSKVSLPTRSARMTKLPGPLTVPPVTLSPTAFSTGSGSPVIMDSSTLEWPSTTFAIHRHLVAGNHAQPVADPHLVERDFVVALVGDLPRRRRREIQQRFDGAAGAAAGAQFQHLTKQHQHDDHRSRLEVDGDLALHAASWRGTDRA
jgi:hypothetical protein